MEQLSSQPDETPTMRKRPHYEAETARHISHALWVGEHHFTAELQTIEPDRPQLTQRPQATPFINRYRDIAL